MITTQPNNPTTLTTAEEQGLKDNDNPTVGELLSQLDNLTELTAAEVQKLNEELQTLKAKCERDIKRHLSEKHQSIQMALQNTTTMAKQNALRLNAERTFIQNEICLKISCKNQKALAKLEMKRQAYEHLLQLSANQPGVTEYLSSMGRQIELTRKAIDSEYNTDCATARITLQFNETLLVQLLKMEQQYAHNRKTLVAQSLPHEQLQVKLQELKIHYDHNKAELKLDCKWLCKEHTIRKRNKPNIAKQLSMLASQIERKQQFITTKKNVALKALNTLNKREALDMLDKLDSLKALDSVEALEELHTLDARVTTLQLQKLREELYKEYTATRPPTLDTYSFKHDEGLKLVMTTQMEQLALTGLKPTAPYYKQLTQHQCAPIPPRRKTFPTHTVQFNFDDSPVDSPKPVGIAQFTKDEQDSTKQFITELLWHTGTTHCDGNMRKYVHPAVLVFIKSQIHQVRSPVQLLLVLQHWAVINPQYTTLKLETIMMDYSHAIGKPLSAYNKLYEALRKHSQIQEQPYITIANYAEQAKLHRKAAQYRQSSGASGGQGCNQCTQLRTISDPTITTQLTPPNHQTVSAEQYATEIEPILTELANALNILNGTNPTLAVMIKALYRQNNTTVNESVMKILEDNPESLAKHIHKLITIGTPVSTALYTVYTKYNKCIQAQNRAFNTIMRIISKHHETLLALMNSTMPTYAQTGQELAHYLLESRMPQSAIATCFMLILQTERITHYPNSQPIKILQIKSMPTFKATISMIKALNVLNASQPHITAPTITYAPIVTTEGQTAVDTDAMQVYRNRSEGATDTTDATSTMQLTPYHTEDVVFADIQQYINQIAHEQIEANTPNIMLFQFIMTTMDIDLTQIKALNGKPMVRALLGTDENIPFVAQVIKLHLKQDRQLQETTGKQQTLFSALSKSPSIRAIDFRRAIVAATCNPELADLAPPDTELVVDSVINLEPVANPEPTEALEPSSAKESRNLFNSQHIRNVLDSNNPEGAQIIEAILETRKEFSTTNVATETMDPQLDVNPCTDEPSLLDYSINTGNVQATKVLLKYGAKSNKITQTSQKQSITPLCAGLLIITSAVTVIAHIIFLNIKLQAHITEATKQIITICQNALNLTILGIAVILLVIACISTIRNKKSKNTANPSESQSSIPKETNPTETEADLPETDANPVKTELSPPATTMEHIHMHRDAPILKIAFT